MQTTGIIMAGGKNSRMGAQKAFLRVGKETMLENAVRQLEKVVDHIMVVTTRPEAFSHLGLDIVTDIFPECGPLGGIHAGLTYSPSDINLVVACDMPFISHRLLEYLLRHGKNYDVVIPRLGNYLEPLVACYNKSCLEVIEEHLRAGRLKITSFFSRVNVMYVDREKIARLANPDYVFFNVNTPQDLERAREIKRKLGLLRDN